MRQSVIIVTWCFCDLWCRRMPRRSQDGSRYMGMCSDHPGVACCCLSFSGRAPRFSSWPSSHSVRKSWNGFSRNFCHFKEGQRIVSIALFTQMFRNVGVKKPPQYSGLWFYSEPNKASVCVFTLWAGVLQPEVWRVTMECRHLGCCIRASEVPYE